MKTVKLTSIWLSLESNIGRNTMKTESREKKWPAKVICARGLTSSFPADLRMMTHHQTTIDKRCIAQPPSDQSSGSGTRATNSPAMSIPSAVKVAMMHATCDPRRASEKPI